MRPMQSGGELLLQGRGEFPHPFERGRPSLGSPADKWQSQAVYQFGPQLYAGHVLDTVDDHPRLDRGR